METERTKVDWCFSDKTREVGYWYFVNNLVSNVSKNGNTYSCKCDKYNTMIEFSTNRKEEIDDSECNCSFYENEDNFCPHVYALVCHVFKVLKEESVYSTKFLDKYKNINKEKLKKEFDNGNIDMIDLDILGYKYEELFPDRNSDPLFDKLDAYIESMPMDVLEKAKKQTILEGEDTSILDKAIKNKKQKEQRKNNNLFGMFVWNLLFDNKKENKLNNTNSDYEPYQFEEEELEEDDYYYEDDNEK